MKTRFRYGPGLGILIVAMMILLAGFGCSDEAKNDAAKLEQELAGGSVDSAADTTSAVASPTEVSADVSAVPEEEAVNFGPSGSGYALQVASCESRDYANYLVDKYVGRGYTCYQTSFSHIGQTYFRVRLGPYETREEANRVKAEVLDKYSVDAWIDVE